jgi:outer membrane protein OmpA-like peptidoglycan-associated protein
MAGGRRTVSGLVLAAGLAMGLAGCSGPVGLYHDAEGGAIALPRQAPPGADMPYPNLASVPAAPVALSPRQQAQVSQRIAGTAPDVSAPAAGALAGLVLPGAAPPPPDVPGLNLPAVPTPYMAPVAAAPAPAPRAAASTPVALSFAPGSALLSTEAAKALAGMAAARGQQNVLVAGFGEAACPPGDAAALGLALARAQRLAAGLTADGVPPKAIRLVVAAAGSGGFVQLVY